jgi:hypothetical protein
MEKQVESLSWLLNNHFRWDEWVELDRVVTLNDSGLQLQKKLAQDHSKTAGKTSFIDVSPSLS